MKALYINKTKIVDDFKRLSDIWDTSTNITLRIDIKPQDFDLVVRSLISYLPNDLAYRDLCTIDQSILPLVLLFISVLFRILAL